MDPYNGDPDQFVGNNRETLVRIVKHGDDRFVRALAMNALVLYGSNPDLEDVEREIQRAKEEANRD